ncbi:MAG: DUF4340 domain-containing protein [Acidobacteriota bacterium]
MRGLRSTIALIVVLGGLGAYIYFVTWKKSPETTAPQEKVFVGFDADKVEELKITSDKGEVTTLKKSSGAWQLVAPVTTTADESEASAIVNALGQLSISRIVDENPSDLKDYGLASPRFEVDYKPAGAASYRRILVGDKSPTGSDLFAKRNDDKRVFLIPAAQEGTFNKSTFDLRDKIVLKFERDKVDGVDVTADGKTLQIAKDNMEWKITQPLQARADYGSVEGLIGRLQTTAMKSIVADAATPEELKKYGLDKPAATVQLKLGSASATFVVGAKAEGNTVYARDASKMAVVTVDSMLADDLKKGAGEYRRKDVFEFRPFNATRLEITRGGQTVAFEKVKGEGKDAVDKWRRATPNPADADKDKMDSLLSRLSNMRATAFVDASAKTGLNAPAMTVSAKYDDGKKEEKVSFGKSDADVYVSKPGEPGAAKVDATDFNEATKTLDELSK